MTIYVDDGKAVKIYKATPKIAKAVMTLLEADEGMVWSKTDAGYGVTIVDMTESYEKSEEDDKE